MTIDSVSRLCELVESKFQDDKKTTVLYRGHGAKSFLLQPKVGRGLQPNANTEGKRVNQERMLELFRRQSIDRLERQGISDWELLTIAQHHGMATCLLDWTRSPLVALFFCVWKEVERRHTDGQPTREDAELIAWRCRKVDLTRSLPQPGPLKLKKPIRFIPRIVTARLRAQSGVLTAHPNPNVDFVPDGELHRLRVPFAERGSLKKALYRLGVHEASLFPDLDALAAHSTHRDQSVHAIVITGTTAS